MKRRNDSLDQRSAAEAPEDLPPTRTKRAKVAKFRPASLRIIGGDMRGRLVHYHGAEFTRPMKDSVRENLFNITGPAIRGSICFDLFSGTGALAFEALSRGASRAIAVEQSRHAAAQIRQTAETLGVSERLILHSGDAFRWAPKLLAPPTDDTPWLVLLSPPYAMWDDMLDGLNQMIRMTLENAPPGSILVAETDKRFDPEKLPPGDWDLRRYGGTLLAIIEPANCCGLDL